MPESAEFFDLIKEAGFTCHPKAKCVYVFTRTAEIGVKGGWNGQYRDPRNMGGRVVEGADELKIDEGR